MAALEQEAIPLDVALSNGRPTVVEFYASWWVNCWCCCMYQPNKLHGKGPCLLVEAF
jgi:hypothetical protein